MSPELYRNPYPANRNEFMSLRSTTDFGNVLSSPVCALEKLSWHVVIYSRTAPRHDTLSDIDHATVCKVKSVLRLGDSGVYYVSVILARRWIVLVDVVMH